ncbi:cell division regulator GpsB [Halalkalibacillus halophilus]|uniref:cell division regulator GpsB n=1 Tax=Halalkalibacillus halophilus TaxID=392827 RepID=UPI0003FF9758|nr:cell division regulator GpsB [Halalkalibacillus halophilus]
MANVQLNSQEILDKEFKTTMRGYNQDEVDEFLDTVIKDYDTFEAENKRLREELERLKNATSGAAPQPQPQQQPSPSRSTVNADVLQRLSNLEKVVFGRKEY